MRVSKLGFRLRIAHLGKLPQASMSLKRVSSLLLVFDLGMTPVPSPLPHKLNKKKHTGKIMLVEAVHVQMSMIDIWLIGVIGIMTSLNKCPQIRGSVLEL